MGTCFSQEPVDTRSEEPGNYNAAFSRTRSASQEPCQPSKAGLAPKGSSTAPGKQHATDPEDDHVRQGSQQLCAIEESVTTVVVVSPILGGHHHDEAEVQTLGDDDGGTAPDACGPDSLHYPSLPPQQQGRLYASPWSSPRQLAGGTAGVGGSGQGFHSYSQSSPGIRHGGSSPPVPATPPAELVEHPVSLHDPMLQPISIPQLQQNSSFLITSSSSSISSTGAFQFPAKDFSNCRDSVTDDVDSAQGQGTKSSSSGCTRAAAAAAAGPPVSAFAVAAAQATRLPSPFVQAAEQQNQSYLQGVLTAASTAASSLPDDMDSGVPAACQPLPLWAVMGGGPSGTTTTSSGATFGPAASHSPFPVSGCLPPVAPAAAAAAAATPPANANVPPLTLPAQLQAALVRGNLMAAAAANNNNNNNTNPASARSSPFAQPPCFPSPFGTSASNAGYCGGSSSTRLPVLQSQSVAPFEAVLAAASQSGPSANSSVLCMPDPSFSAGVGKGSGRWEDVAGAGVARVGGNDLFAPCSFMLGMPPPPAARTSSSGGSTIAQRLSMYGGAASNEHLVLQPTTAASSHHYSEASAAQLAQHAAAAAAAAEAAQNRSTPHSSSGIYSAACPSPSGPIPVPGDAGAAAAGAAMYEAGGMECLWPAAGPPSLDLGRINREIKNLSWLGRGAGGVVYRALWHDVPVAIKFMLSSSPSNLNDKYREAILARYVSHPNVVQTYTYDCGYVSEQLVRVARAASRPLSNDALSQRSLGLFDQLETTTPLIDPYGHLRTAVMGTTDGAGGLLQTGGGGGGGIMATQQQHHLERTNTAAMVQSRVNSFAAGVPPGLMLLGTGAASNLDTASIYGDTDASLAPASGWSIADVLLHIGAQQGQYLTHIIMELCDAGTLLAAIKQGVFSGCSGSTSSSTAPAASAGSTSSNQAPATAADPSSQGAAASAGGAGAGAASASNGDSSSRKGGAPEGAAAAADNAAAAAAAAAAAPPVGSRGGVRSQHQKFKALLRTAREVARGVAFLHSLNIIHGDLKPGNVLLRSSAEDRRGFVAKVADFGLATHTGPLGGNGGAADEDGQQAEGRLLDEPKGTPAYLAPEVATQGLLSRSADIWSLGVILWQLCTGEQPFAGLRQEQLLYGMQQQTLMLTWPADVYSPLRKLGELCMDYEPRNRPTAEQVAKALLKIEQHLSRKSGSKRKGGGGGGGSSSSPQRAQPAATSSTTSSTSSHAQKPWFGAAHHHLPAAQLMPPGPLPPMPEGECTSNSSGC